MHVLIVCENGADSVSEVSGVREAQAEIREFADSYSGGIMLDDGQWLHNGDAYAHLSAAWM
jgi:hypothetical protein